MHGQEQAQEPEKPSCPTVELLGSSQLSWHSRATYHCWPCIEKVVILLIIVCPSGLSRSLALSIFSSVFTSLRRIICVLRYLC